MTAKAEYLGQLRVKNTHLQSGDVYQTDAPTDNHGKGEAFSPTDTVATALAGCILTTIGIKAEDKGVDIRGAYAEVTKTMASHPRRISKVEIELYFPEKYEDKFQKILQNSAKTCPVLQSLHPDMEKVLNFHYHEN